MGYVIPVQPAPEPADFNEQVRLPGLRWLQKHKLPLSGPIPPGTLLEPAWRACMKQLHRGYGGHCGYVSFYIEPVTGHRTADHFVPKSRHVELAYEWSNYRLACGKINARKQNFEDVLDPFEIEDQTFELNLCIGSIHPSPRLRSAQRQAAEATIQRLRLDDGECRHMRKVLIDSYVTGQIDEDILRHYSPFVWHEMRRQDWLFVGR